MSEDINVRELLIEVHVYLSEIGHTDDNKAKNLIDKLNTVLVDDNHVAISTIMPGNNESIDDIITKVEKAKTELAMLSKFSDRERVNNLHIEMLDLFSREAKEKKVNEADVWIATALTVASFIKTYMKSSDQDNNRQGLLLFQMLLEAVSKYSVSIKREATENSNV